MDMVVGMEDTGVVVMDTVEKRETPTQSMYQVPCLDLPLMPKLMLSQTPSLIMDMVGTVGMDVFMEDMVGMVMVEKSELLCLIEDTIRDMVVTEVPVDMDTEAMVDTVTADDTKILTT